MQRVKSDRWKAGAGSGITRGQRSEASSQRRRKAANAERPTLNAERPMAESKVNSPWSCGQKSGSKLIPLVGQIEVAAEAQDRIAPTVRL